MKEIYNKINEFKDKIQNIEGEEYKELFDSIANILEHMTSEVEEIAVRQNSIEENIEFIDNDLTGIQDELFEEVSFDELDSFEDEYVEIHCEHCNKPLFVEKEALDKKTAIPCPFCNESAK